MAKVIGEGKFPKRIGDFVLYPLCGDLIIRAKSGFTTKALKTSAKYDLSRKNASEFGRVSSTCKELRVALKEYLPKKNNLLVVNSLTKKMRQLLVFDTQSERGERTLAKALATEEAQHQLKGYHFNPESAIFLNYTSANNQVQLATDGVKVPDGATSVSFTVVALQFDFDTKVSSKLESERSFFSLSTLPESVTLKVPEMEFSGGVLFTILVTDFYLQQDGSYVPLLDDSCKIVMIIT